MPLVQRRAVPCQMHFELVQARCAVDGGVDVDEVAGREQATRSRLGHHAANRDLVHADTRRGRDGGDEGHSDRILRVAEGSDGRVERDDGSDLLGVGALEARVAAAAEERRAASGGDCVGRARLDCSRIGTVGVGLAEGAVDGAANIKGVLANAADLAVGCCPLARIWIVSTRGAVGGVD